MDRTSPKTKVKKQLNLSLKQTDNLRVWKRIKAVQLRAGNLQTRQVARLLDVSEDSIANWVKAFEVSGIKALTEFKYRPRKSVLDPYLKKIRQLIKKSKINTIKNLRQQIESQYQIQIGETGLYKWCQKNSIKLYA